MKINFTCSQGEGSEDSAGPSSPRLGPKFPANIATTSELGSSQIELVLEGVNWNGMEAKLER